MLLLPLAYVCSTFHSIAPYSLSLSLSYLRILYHKKLTPYYNQRVTCLGPFTYSKRGGGRFRNQRHSMSKFLLVVKRDRLALLISFHVFFLIGATSETVFTIYIYIRRGNSNIS